MLLKVDNTKVNKKVFLTIESVNNIIAGCLVYLIGSFMFESKKSSWNVKKKKKDEDKPIFLTLDQLLNYIKSVCI